MEACAQLLAMHNAGAMPDPARGVLGSVCHAGILLGWQFSRPMEDRMYMYKTFDTPGGRVLISACFMEDVRCMTVSVTFSKGLRVQHIFKPWTTATATNNDYSFFDHHQTEFLKDLHAGFDNMARLTKPCSFFGNNVSCHGHYGNTGT